MFKSFHALATNSKGLPNIVFRNILSLFLLLSKIYFPRPTWSISNSERNHIDMYITFILFVYKRIVTLLLYMYIMRSANFANEMEEN